MIEPKSTDLGRDVCYHSRHVRGPVVGFDHAEVEVRLNGLLTLVRRADLEWADVVAAREVFAAAGFDFEMVTDDVMRVAGCLYWVRNGLFARRDGPKGSGGAIALVRHLKGLPAVGPATRPPAALDLAGAPTVLARPICALVQCPHPELCREGCASAR